MYSRSFTFYALLFYEYPGGKLNLCTYFVNFFSVLSDTASLSRVSTTQLKKVKVKLTLEQATKAQKGIRSIVLLFL